MTKGYEKYLPEKQGERRLIQAKIDTALHNQVKALIDKEGWTWHELMEGLLKKFIDDNKTKKSA